jgi:hypothetical protein
MISSRVRCDHGKTDLGTDVAWFTAHACRCLHYKLGFSIIGGSATFQVNNKNKRSPLLRRLKKKSKNYVVIDHSVQDPNNPTPNQDSSPIKSEVCVGPLFYLPHTTKMKMFTDSDSSVVDA